MRMKVDWMTRFPNFKASICCNGLICFKFHCEYHSDFNGSHWLLNWTVSTGIKGDVIGTSTTNIEEATFASQGEAGRGNIRNFNVSLRGSVPHQRSILTTGVVVTPVAHAKPKSIASCLPALADGFVADGGLWLTCMGKVLPDSNISFVIQIKTVSQAVLIRGLVVHAHVHSCFRMFHICTSGITCFMFNLSHASALDPPHPYG